MDTCHEGAIAMRTIIQLDGDVLTFATAAASDGAVRGRHGQSVQARLRYVAERLDGSAEIATWHVGVACFLVAGVCSFPWESELDGWGMLDWTWFVANVVVSAVVGLAGRIGLFRRLLWKGLVSLGTRRR